MKKIVSATFFLLFMHPAFSQSFCGNKDFEDQNFTNWIGATGDVVGTFPNWTGPINQPANNTPPTGTGQHTILTVNSLDPIVTELATGLPDPYMTTLAPGGGTASVLLGNAQTGYGTEKLSYTFPVTTSDTVFDYQFALVLQDPAHPVNEQPYFAIKFYDGSGNIIPAISNTISTLSSPYPLILTTYSFTDLYYKRWSGVSVNLGAYVGQNITVEFQTADCGQGGHFGYAYIDVSCWGSSISDVWPGDADYDLLACSVDLLSLGLGYGYLGPVRPSATINWQAEPSANWAQNFPLGANLKHSDCNGDGTINGNDTVAILQNYNLTHPFRYIQQEQVVSAPDLYLVPQPGSIGSGQWGTIDIMLGTSTVPVNGLYGLTFKINYDPTVIDPSSAKVIFSNSWLGIMGADAIELCKNFGTSGFTDAAVTRIDHGNSGGFGKIGTFYYLTTNIPTVDTLPFTISNVMAIEDNKSSVTLNTTGTIVLAGGTIGLTDYTFEDIASLYPNPAKESVALALHSAISSAEILDPSGRVIYKTNSMWATLNISTENFPSGIYFVRITCKEGSFVKKLVIKK